MKYRPNDKAKLVNTFATSDFTDYDSLTIKWPHNAERVNDTNWLREDEKPLVPFIGRIIRASDLNSYADSIVSLQHYLKEKHGNIYLLTSSGEVSLCVSPTLDSNTLTYTTPASVLAEDDTLVSFTQVTHTGATVTSSLTSAVSISGTVSIPAVFGSDPYANRSFNVVGSIEVQGSSDKGWFEASTDAQALEKARGSYTGWVGTAPGSSLTQFNYHIVLSKMTSMTPASSSSIEVEYPWTITKNLAGNEFNTDSTSVLRTLVKSSYTSSYSFWYTASASSTGTAYPNGGLDNITAVPGSLNRLECKGSAIWSGSYPPYSTAGGLIYHEDVYNQSYEDTGIEFSWHSWNLPTLWVQNYPHFHIAGPALRVSSHTTPKTVSGYTSGTQYYGYAVKFFAYPNNRTLKINDFNNAPGSYNKDIVFAGSVAIVKFRYDDFGYDDNLYSLVYINGLSNANLLGNGGWWGTYVTGTNSDGYYKSDTIPAEYKVLASTVTEYVSGTGSYDPILQLNPANTSWYFAGLHYWRFEMVGDTLTLSRSTDGSSWTTVLTYVDSDPFTYSSGVKIPSAFYNKSYTGSQMSESEMVFSNIKSYAVTEPDSTEPEDSTLDLKVKFLISMANTSNANLPVTNI